MAEQQNFSYNLKRAYSGQEIEYCGMLNFSDDGSVSGFETAGGINNGFRIVGIRVNKILALTRINPQGNVVDNVFVLNQGLNGAYEGYCYNLPHNLKFPLDLFRDRIMDILDKISCPGIQDKASMIISNNTFKDCPVKGPNPKNTVIKESSDFNWEDVEITEDQEGNTIYSFPIYILLDCESFENRKYSDAEITVFLHEHLGYESRIEGVNLTKYFITQIIHEIIKNSVEHTNGKIYFGLQIIQNKDKSRFEVSFIVVDEGNGIYENIKRATGNQALSFKEAYEIAFKDGWSSKEKNPSGKEIIGAGLDFIRSLTRDLRGVTMEISIFDHGIEYKLDSPDRPNLTEAVFEVDPINKFRVAGNITVQK